jgi:hypothetical protein
MMYVTDYLYFDCSLPPIMNFVMLFVQPKNQQRSDNERQLDYNGFCDCSIPTSMPVALATGETQPAASVQRGIS